MAQFATKAPPGMYFETGGVLFGTKPFCRGDETVLKQEFEYRLLIRLGSHLDAVVQQISRCNGSAGGQAVIEASAAVLAVISLAIFAAHALDAYRTG